MEALLSPILLESTVNSPPPLSGDYVPSVTDLSLEILLHIANTSHSDLQKIQEGVIKLCDSIGLQAGNFIAYSCFIVFYIPTVIKVKNPTFKLNSLLFLPAAVHLLIVKECNLESLLALSATCRYYFHYTKRYIQNRTQNLISKFHISPDRLFHIMNYYGAIIGGSCALSMIDAEASTFHPLEMTLYLPYEYRNTLSTSLFQHFHLLGRITEQNHNSLVTLIEWYAFGRPNDLPLHIIAVFMTTNFPIEALFHSQYSITLNAITSKGIFSAYRSLTSLGRSLVGEKSLFPSPILTLKAYNNPFALCPTDKHALVGAFGIALPYWTIPPGLFLCLGAQYKMREVFFTRHLSNFHNHQCRSEFSCPMTSRTTVDPGCLFFPFSKFKRLKGWPGYSSHSFTPSIFNI